MTEKFEVFMKIEKINFPKIRIQTRRLVIRPLELTDYQKWLEGYTQRKPKTYKYDLSARGPSFSSRMENGKTI